MSGCRSRKIRQCKVNLRLTLVKINLSSVSDAQTLKLGLRKFEYDIRVACLKQQVEDYHRPSVG